MKVSVLAMLMFCGMLAPVGAQDALVSLLKHPPAAVAPSDAVTPEHRAGIFSALAAMPAETESFFAIRGVGNFFKLRELAALARELPMLAMASGLDGLALGMSDASARDLERLLPLFESISGNTGQIADIWASRAEPAAGLAIVAQQRETDQKQLDALVAATRQFHVAPVYLALSSRPESVSLLHTISMLPMMMPATPNGEVEPMLQGELRGLCVRCDKLDLDAAGLPADVEQQVKQNLSSARLYVLMRVVQNRLVLAICTHPEEVRWTVEPADSLLGTAGIEKFDAMMQPRAVALGECSAVLVNLRAKSNLQGYRDMATFLGGVFSRLADGSETAAAAAEAVQRILQVCEQTMPACQGGETLKIWQDEDVYMEFTADARGQYFEPDHISACQEQPGAVLTLQGTPLRGGAELDIPALLRDIQAVHDGYKMTLKPEFVAATENEFQDFRQLMPALTHLSNGIRMMYQSLGADSAMQLLSNNTGALRLSIADSAVFAAGEKEVSAAGDAFYALLRADEVPRYKQWLDRWKTERTDDALLVTYGHGALQLQAASETTSVPGGVAFCLHVAELAELLDAVGKETGKRSLCRTADDMKSAAALIQRIEGVVTTCDNRVRVLLRVVETKN